mgnify:CR=1 FL=1
MNQKGKRILMGLVALVVVLLLALWGIPALMLAVESNAAPTKAEAAQLIADYPDSSAAPAEKAVCRDLIALKKQNIRVSRIVSAEGDKIVYEMKQAEGVTTEVTTYVDVTRDWNGTLYYHTTDDQQGEGTIRVRPWGSVRIY